MSISLTGQDTIIINNRVISDLADADCGTLNFPNELASLKTGKNGNAIYALNNTGKECDVVLRVVRGSEDDKFLNGLLAVQNANFSAFILMSGEFIKKVGDGQGNVNNDTYIMNGGIFSKQVGAKSNVEGDSEQSVAIYEMKFANSPRVIS